MTSITIKRVKQLLRDGATLTEALAGIDMTYNQWRSLCRQEGVTIRLPRGKRAAVYTPERVRAVKRRISKGEFLKDIAPEMGMDPRNLARYCRNNGIELFSATDLKKNYQRRDRSNAGRPLGKPNKKTLIQKSISAGLTDREIAEEMGVTQQYVNMLRKSGANEQTGAGG